MTIYQFEFLSNTAKVGIKRQSINLIYLSSVVKCLMIYP